ncbi:MAG: hypothetical protein NXH88_02615 [Hyphomonas sp.]|nr:hypothetical protein [Hyphomonas sp.]
MPGSVRNEANQALGMPNPRDLIVKIDAGGTIIDSWVNQRGWKATGRGGGADSRAVYASSGADADALQAAIVSGAPITAWVATPDGTRFDLFLVSFAATDSSVTSQDAAPAPLTSSETDLSGFEAEMALAHLNGRTSKALLDKACVVELGAAKRDEVRARLTAQQQDASATARGRQENYDEDRAATVAELADYSSPELTAPKILARMFEDGDCRSREQAKEFYRSECQRAGGRECECKAEFFAENFVSKTRIEWGDEVQRLRTDAMSACR